MGKTKGGVSKKTINGKVYFYHQWYEDGVRRSKLISEEEALLLRQSLKESPKEGISFGKGIHVLKGEELSIAFAYPSSQKRRYMYRNMATYLYGPLDGRIACLYGLRRTGKTTLMLQLASELELEKTAYVTLGKEVDASMLSMELDDLYQKGVRYVFLDEVTLMKDFVSSCAFLADYFGRKMKLVMAGTDSLGFYLASKNSLYDRLIMLHTTFIPFREFSEVLGINDIDTYIEYGGTMVREGIDYHNEKAPIFYDEGSSLSYVDTSIVDNLLRSLRMYKDGEILDDLHSSMGLREIVNRVLQDSSHRFLKDVLERKFRSRDYGSFKDLVRKKEGHESLGEVVDTLDEKKVYSLLLNSLEIRENPAKVEQSDLDMVKVFLNALDVIRDVEEFDLDSRKTRRRTVFLQPGLRYSQAKALLESLLQIEEFSSLPKKDIRFVEETILNDVKDLILEELVRYESSLGTLHSCKLTFLGGEIDMVIYHDNPSYCYLYEIKHSKGIDPKQTRFLLDEEISSRVEREFGEIKGRYVLYRGENKEEGGVTYLNVSSYLKSLPV